MAKAKRIKYSPFLHGPMENWKSGNPDKRGYYTVMTYIQSAPYVSEDYFWNGSQWVTPGHSLAKSVGQYLPESYRGE